MWSVRFVFKVKLRLYVWWCDVGKVCLQGKEDLVMSPAPFLELDLHVIKGVGCCTLCACLFDDAPSSICLVLYSD